MKKAFTMIELIFVIVVIGILAVVVMPRSSSNKLQEAATQVVSHIRYTQHLAMIDDKFDSNDATWWKERWQIRFRRNSGSSGYVIFSDTNQLGNVDVGNEEAVDPLSKQRMNGHNGWNNGDLTAKYGIFGNDSGIVQSCFTTDGSLVTSNRGVFVFDHFGRPYSGVSNATSPTQYLIVANCDLTLSSAEGNVTIRVYPETGYACILNNATGQCQ